MTLKPSPGHRACTSPSLPSVAVLSLDSTARLGVLGDGMVSKSTEKGAPWGTVGLNHLLLPHIRVFLLCRWSQLISGLIRIIVPRGYDKGHTFDIYS